MDSRLRGNDSILGNDCALGNDGILSSIFREQFKIARVD